jgi:hypothetical protein
MIAFSNNAMTHVGPLFQEKSDRLFQATQSPTCDHLERKNSDRPRFKKKLSAIASFDFE